MTALHMAAKRGYKDSIENLVDTGTDINIADDDGVSGNTTDSMLELAIWICISL